MPTIEGEWTVWDEADRLSVLFGIKVCGWQDNDPGKTNTYTILLEARPELDPGDLVAGRISPTGVVILYIDQTNAVSLWELSPHASKIYRACGGEQAPDALASLFVQ